MKSTKKTAKIAPKAATPPPAPAAPTTAAAPIPTSRRAWLVAAAVAGVLAVGGGIFWAATRSTPPREDKPAGPPLSQDLSVPSGSPWFRDMTAQSGVKFIYRNGEEADQFTILESVGGGGAMIDYDGDGLLDLFFPGGGTLDGSKIKGLPCRLFKNLGNWKFLDVSHETGVERIDFYSHGCAVADYNRDGLPDLLVTGYGRIALLRNERKDGKHRFVDVTKEAGLDVDKSWSTSAGFADLTGSGYPDLYVCHYVDWSFEKNNPLCTNHVTGERDVCTPQKFKPLAHALYRNKGDGTFRDASAELKLRKDGSGLGVLLADFGGALRPSIYVANDATKNHLYMNRGGMLEEKGLLAGVDSDEGGMPNGSMGVDVADYDGSGRASLFVTNYQGEYHSLYQNLGRESFGYQSKAVGLGALGMKYVGFGAAFIDVDNDGWEDLFIVDGHVLRRPNGSTVKQLPVLLRNVEAKGRRFFQTYNERGGDFFTTAAVARGLAIGDLDNDGWSDAVVSNMNSPAVLLRNEAYRGSDARWLGVKLVGRDHRDVVGSTVVLQTGSRTLTRFAKGGGSYLSSSDRRILFGLGSDSPGRLTVKWSWGKEQTWDSLTPGSYWELREGEATAKKL